MIKQKIKEVQENLETSKKELLLESVVYEKVERMDKLFYYLSNSNKHVNYKQAIKDLLDIFKDISRDLTNYLNYTNQLINSIIRNQNITEQELIELTKISESFLDIEVAHKDLIEKIDIINDCYTWK